MKKIVFENLTEFQNKKLSENFQVPSGFDYTNASNPVENFLEECSYWLQTDLEEVESMFGMPPFMSVDDDFVEDFSDEALEGFEQILANPDLIKPYIDGENIMDASVIPDERTIDISWGWPGDSDDEY